MKITGRKCAETCMFPVLLSAVMVIFIQLIMSDVWLKVITFTCARGHAHCNVWLPYKHGTHSRGCDFNSKV